MSKANEPAFPVKGDAGYKPGCDLSGLSKREYFAALALQGMMSLHPSILCKGPDDEQTVGEWVALTALDAADALLAELEKGFR